MKLRFVAYLGVLFSAMLMACQADAPEASNDGPDGPTGVEFPMNGDTSLEPFCERERPDAVRDLFCSGEASEISGLSDLLERLHLSYTNADGQQYAVSTTVLLGHSTALPATLVSPINPRAILIGQDTILAFNRGLQKVEIASRDRIRHIFNFYLLSFDQSCNASPGGCAFGDLYTPRVESDWIAMRLEDDEDLKNSPFDCRQCHQRGREEPILLMRELKGPWTHFFAPEVADGGDTPEVSGADLVRDYLRAKGDESYARIPEALIRNTFAFNLQLTVDQQQPLEFDGATIASERWPQTADGYVSEPMPSPTWYKAYEAFKRGEHLPLPHFEPRPTDPVKQQTLTNAYRSYRAGDIAAEDLPDLADIFPDDPQVRAEIGLQTEPLATPAEILIQACGPCHNDVLDQSISRARFNIALSRMGRTELGVAIARLEVAQDTPGTMPPVGRRQLDDDARRRLIDYLRQDERPSEDDTLLDRAARLGMASTQL